MKRRKRRISTQSTTQRGYGWRHQQLRERWAREVALGGVSCARCGVLIAPGEPFDLGHDDHNRGRYTGPEHRRCNRATAGRRKPTAAVPEIKRRYSRHWWGDDERRKGCPCATCVAHFAAGGEERSSLA